MGPIVTPTRRVLVHWEHDMDTWLGVASSAGVTLDSCGEEGNELS